MVIQLLFSRITRYAMRSGWMFAVVLVFCGCGSDPVTTRSESEGYSPVEIGYAKGFKLWSDTAANAFLLEVSDPRDSSGEVLHRYNFGSHPEERSGVELPVRRLALGSTTFPPYLQRIGASSLIAAVGHGDRVMDEKLSARIRSGEIREIVSGERVDTEKLLSVNPDVFLPNDYGEADLDRIASLGIPTVILTEYLEPHPLGRAEWLLVFGALTDRLAEAQAAFREIEGAYHAAAAQVDTTAGTPRVFAGSRYGDFWYAPGGNSYLAAFFRDAGADYVFSDRRWEGNAQLDFEAALAAVSHADYWGLILASEEDFTLDQLKAMDERYASLRAFSEGKVFVCNSMKVDYFGRAVVEPHLILTDLIRIFHGNGEGDFHYFRPVE